MFGKIAVTRKPVNGWRIGNVLYENIGPLENATVDWNVPGLTLVEGRINRGWAHSNGAGKSTLLTGILWALYNKFSANSVRPVDMVRLGAEGAMRVRAELTDGIWIDRYFHGNTQRVSVGQNDREWTRGTNTMSNELIEATLGLSFEAFTTCVVFGASDWSTRFFSATDVQRKEIIESILNLGQFDWLHEEARKTRLKLQNERSILEGRLTVISEMLSRQTVVEKDFDALVEKTRQEGLAVKARVERLMEVQKSAEDAYERLIADRNAAQTAHTASMAGHYAKIAAADKAVMQADYVLRTLKADAKRLAADIAQCAADKCPTCGQKLPSDSGHKKGLEAKERELRDKISDAEEQVGALRGARTAIGNPATFDDTYADAIDAKQKEVRKYVSQVSDLNQQLTTLRGEIKVLREQQAAYAQKLAERRKMEEEYATAKEKLANSQQELDVQSILVDGFGPSGVRSLILESELGKINQQAAYLADRLLGPGSYVEMRATQELKSSDRVKDALHIAGAIPGCAQSYPTASQGQKRRIDLVILLSLQKVLSERFSQAADQIFIDELFDGLDRTGVEFAGDLLREMAQTRPVVVITHLDALKTYAQRIITVHHDGSETHPKAVVSIA